ncbi:unnamed protein product [Moneuplotes crassus]|uniref:Uncharacterized protein n=1 Tax=Euplotes crassus TaxID=5936 RepID=A0AAD1UD86_EUPCR|nr:unnamed protein product [Moneuplotes crassus]
MMMRRLSNQNSRRNSQKSKIPAINCNPDENVEAEEPYRRQRRNNLYDSKVLQSTVNTQELLSPIPVGVSFENVFKKLNEMKELEHLTKKVLICFKKLNKNLKQVTKDDITEILQKLFSGPQNDSKSPLAAPISNKMCIEAFLELRKDLFDAENSPDIENFCKWILENQARIQDISKISKQVRRNVQKKTNETTVSYKRFRASLKNREMAKSFDNLHKLEQSHPARLNLDSSSGKKRSPQKHEPIVKQTSFVQKINSNMSTNLIKRPKTFVKNPKIAKKNGLLRFTTSSSTNFTRIPERSSESKSRNFSPLRTRYSSKSTVKGIKRDSFMRENPIQKRRFLNFSEGKTMDLNKLNFLKFPMYRKIRMESLLTPKWHESKIVQDFFQRC